MLEEISPQAYIRFILCFGLHSGISNDEVIRILRQGLKATAENIPVLNSVIVPVTDFNGRETKDLRHKDVTLLTVEDLTGSTLDFAETRSQGFPSQAFNGEMLCPTGIFAVPGSLVPPFLVQANLITSGLLLGLTEQPSLQSSDYPENKSLDTFSLSADAFDKSPLLKVCSAKGGTIEDHPELLLLPEAPTALPPALTQTLKTQIFHISPDSISILKELASPRNSSSPQKEYSSISTHTAISDLIWRSVMAATYAHEHPIPESVSMFCSPLNARKRMDPPLAPDLLASAWCFQDSRLPIKSLLEANLADVALVTRKGTDGVDASYLDSLINMIDSVPNPSLLMPLAFTDILKTCSMFTSWAGFAM